MQTLTILAIAAAFITLSAPAAAQPSAAELEPILRDAQGPFLPELDADPKALAASPVGQDLLEWVAETDWTIPATTYTDYRRYRATGERPPYERPYFAKRELLARAVLGAWLDGAPEYLDRVNDLVWSICEETNWVVPAHEGPHRAIDLFCAETAADLGHVVLLLGDRLPEEIRDRIHAEVDRRVLTPYIEGPNAYGWGDGHHNWTGVCAGSVGEAFLLLEPDPARQAQALEHVLAQLDRYIHRAFTEDGASLEGVGYWSYGLLHYVILGEMLRARTDGAIDLLAVPRVQAVAGFPLAMALDRTTCANFADAEPSLALPPFLVSRLADRADVPSLRALAGRPFSFRLDNVVRNLLWWDGDRDAPFAIENSYLAQAAVARRVAQAGDAPVVLVAKAGHNAEPHNNNDVGSFILHIDGVTYLCDPGRGLYSREYFSNKRYDNLFANAYGHSLPVIGDRAQPAGSDYRGGMAIDGDAVVIRFENAYGLPELREAERRLTLAADGSLQFQDRFVFDGPGLPVKETFMTWLDVETDGAVARIRSDKGDLVLVGEGLAFTTERLEDECKANAKRGVLTRISAQLPPASESIARITMTYEPR